MVMPIQSDCLSIRKGAKYIQEFLLIDVLVG